MSAWPRRCGIHTSATVTKARDVRIKILPSCMTDWQEVLRKRKTCKTLIFAWPHRYLCCSHFLIISIAVTAVDINMQKCFGTRIQQKKIVARTTVLAEAYKRCQKQKVVAEVTPAKVSSKSQPQLMYSITWIIGLVKYTAKFKGH